MYFALLLLLIPCGGVRAAPQDEGEQDAAYTQEEYDAYTAAVENENLAEREDAVIEFIRENPESALVQYAVGAYETLMQQYQSQGEWAALVRSSEKLVELRPDHLGALYFAMLGTYQQEQFDKAAEYGLRVYEMKPDIPQLTYMLAWSFRGIQDQDRYIEFAEKAMPELDPVNQLTFLAELRHIQVERRNWSGAAQYARRALEVLNSAERPAQISQQEWDEYLRRERSIAHAVSGRHAFEGENFQQAIRSYEAALNSYSQNAALNSEAYFYIGMSHWRNGDINAAMEAFAKGAHQPGGDPRIAEVSKKHLERLYRSMHNDSIAGLDEFIERATRSLR